MNAPFARRNPRRYDKRLAANKHSNTVPDVIAVTVMLNRLPAVVENSGKRRSVTGRAFGLCPGVTHEFFGIDAAVAKAGQAQDFAVAQLWKGWGPVTGEIEGTTGAPLKR
jgi:hypothetical protein